jgi:hypothetical protein
MRFYGVKLLLICCAVGTLHPCAAQEVGKVQGFVLNERGSPEMGVTVSVEPLDATPTTSLVRESETDKNGRFAVQNLPLGAYKVFTKKESSSYPDTAFAFYSGNAFPTVMLTEKVPTADLLVKLGPQAGAIAGQIQDRVTGAPIKATFLLKRSDPPNYWISLSQDATFRILVPQNIGISLEISAVGYKTEYYGGTTDSLKREPLRVQSGQEITFNVDLEPVVHH